MLQWKYQFVCLERPECTRYTLLTDDTRSILYGDGTSKGSRVQGSKWYCDTTDTSKFHTSLSLKSPGWVGPAWYRMPAGTPRIPESSPGASRCGTYYTGWLSGVHPTTSGASSDVKYCFTYGSNDCEWFNQGKVTNCGNYFVYYLQNTPQCHLRYCATNWLFLNFIPTIIHLIVSNSLVIINIKLHNWFLYQTIIITFSKTSLHYSSLLKVQTL